MSTEKRVILLTGANGMIGTCLTDRLLEDGFFVIGLDLKKRELNHPCLIQETIDLYDREALEKVFDSYKIDRVIHLAALAHTGDKKYSYEDYYRLNVECAENVFSAASSRSAPVLQISTADVYGFVKGTATSKTPLEPVTDYGKTKAQAEKRLVEICTEGSCKYDIFRLAPVYTPTVKRDIQKRYYLKYPSWSYIVGKGAEYEVLDIKYLIDRICGWIDSEPSNSIFNVKNEKLMNTKDCIKDEKEMGRAKHTVHLPRWMVTACIGTLKLVTGKNKYTYLLNKVTNPIRTED